MKSFFPKPTFKVDDIIDYTTLVAAEGINLQRGMNYLSKPDYSVFLMSVRPNAPYADKWDKRTGTLVYEGHNLAKNFTKSDPKKIDQPLKTPKGTLLENGKFFVAAHAYKMNLTDQPHRIKVYEKIKDGIWCYKGFFSLIDAKIVFDGVRNVFKFYLQPIVMKSFNKEIVLPHNRIIPSSVKVEVWARDKGQCALCGSKENLHFDHDLPYSKGGTSLTAENVKILCARHNLQKSNKILCFPPILLS